MVQPARRRRVAKIPTSPLERKAKSEIRGPKCEPSPRFITEANEENEDGDI
jgi:hypothetical protein